MGQRGKILAKKGNLETFSKAIYDSTKQKINSIATDNTITVVLSVLHREYGFGPKRSRDFYQHVADLTSRINRKTETIAGLKNELHDQCGLTLARKVNDDEGNKLLVNSFHHQAVKSVADGFRINARAKDGIVEGIEWNGEEFAVGVQWHPEMMVEKHPVMYPLFRQFVEEAGKHMAK